ncbi:MAG: hypothetical protein LBF62_04010 [Tannerellaceae bacterium]|jgi:serine/threonine-protein kinase HipA|nr:hypothetical protein [Tannerellaceae bacterium]
MGKSKDINPAKLTILQRQALIGSMGRGALEYRPDYSESAKDEIIDFDQLASETEKILTSDYDGESLDTLYKYGGSSGGARSKVLGIDSKGRGIDSKAWRLPHTPGGRFAG